jgi:hypothetical protein
MSYLTFLTLLICLGYDLDFERRLNLNDPSVLEVSQVYLPLKNETLTSYHMSKYMGKIIFSCLVFIQLCTRMVALLSCLVAAHIICLFFGLGEYELFLLPAEVQMKSAILRFHHIYSPIKSPSHRPLTTEAWNSMKHRYINF